jgi:phosphate transport system substrate-binding protein
MKKTSLVVSILLILAIAIAAQPAGTILLNAAGATFPYPIYSKWFDVYHQKDPNVQINYQSIGSGGGIRQLLAGTVDFGASDGPMTDDQLKEAKFKILHFPTVLGAVIPIYNVSGVWGIEFYAESPVRYLPDNHQVERPEIAKATSGVNCQPPHRCVHRADGSGTSYIFTDFLSKANDWKNKAAKAPLYNGRLGWVVGKRGFLVS